MTLLHETMIIQETPLTDGEIKQYISVEKTLLIGNVDFDKFLKDNNYDINWYLENDEYNVIEILN